MKNNIFKLAAVVFCFMLLTGVGFAAKGKNAPPSSLSPVKEKLRESDEKKHPKPKTAVITSAQISPKKDQPTAVIKTAEPRDTQVFSASVVRDKGRKIKWQIISTGGSCGDNYRTCCPGRQDGCQLCGTVGQIAVGPGTSPSFGVNSGYWQEFLKSFLLGDVNGDGFIDLGDVLYLIAYLYKNGPPPDPLAAGDLDYSRVIDLGDALYLINYLYKNGPAPSC